MATFNYEVRMPDGKTRKGSVEAASIEAAQVDLRALGGMIISLKEASALTKEIDISFGAKVKPRELSIFCRQFESILNAGVTAIEALNMLGEQTENKAFKKTIREVHDSVQKGETLADAMAMHPKIFPEIMIHMIAAGEASGSLDISFNRLAVHFEKDAHLKALIGKSMVYPAVLIVVIIAVVILMMVKIVPSFTSTFDQIDAELPAITLAVMAVSDFFVNSWYWMIIIIVGIVFFVKEFNKTERGALLFGKLMLKLPLFGTLTIKSAAARLTRTLSTLLASGVSLVDSIGIVEKIMSNAIVKAAMKKAGQDVMLGIPLSNPIEDSGVFPPMVYHMIRIGEETGNMEGMMEKVADYYDEEVEMATQSLVAALEPLIIIVMALIVVPIILAVLMPMFSLYSAIG